MTHDEAMGRLPELVGLRTASEGDRELDAHVAGCDRCRARLRQLRAIDAELRALGAPPVPSPGLERRVLAIPGTAPTPVRRRGRAALMVAAALIAVLVVGGGVLAVLTARGGSGSEAGFTAERVVELASPAPRALDARIEIGPAKADRLPVRITATGLAHGSGRFYGLWLTGSGGAVSGGSFRPDGGGRCVVMLQVPAGEWTAVAITAGDRPPSSSTTVASAQL